MSLLKTYTLVVSLAYIGVALLELLFRSVGGAIVFAPASNMLHWLTGGLALVAHAMGVTSQHTFAKMFSSLFVLITLLGLAAPDVFLMVLGSRPAWFTMSMYFGTALVGLYVGFQSVSRPSAPDQSNT